MKEKKALRLAVDFHLAGWTLSEKVIKRGKDMAGNTYGPAENWDDIAGGISSVMGHLERDEPLTQAAIGEQIKKLKPEIRANVTQALGSMKEYQALPEGP